MIKKNKKVLKIEEEIELIQKAQSGDLDARNTILEYYFGLCEEKIESLQNRLSVPITLEDEFSTCILALDRAIHSYDYTKSVRFAVYASVCIEHALYQSMKERFKHTNNESLNELFTHQDLNNHLLDTLMNDEENIDDEIARKEKAKALYAVLDKLKPNERTALALKFGLYDKKIMTDEEIAKVLNCPVSTVKLYVKNGLYSIRKYLAKNKVKNLTDFTL